MPPLYEKIHKLTELQKREEKRFPPIKTKPSSFEPNIFKAIVKGDLQNVQYLIENEGVSKNEIVPKTADNLYKGDSLIHIASYRGKLPIVRYLIEKQKVDQNMKGWCGNTPLHFAAMLGQVDVAEYLVDEADADIESTNNYGQTPLHVAASYAFPEIISFLFSRGANMNALTKSGQTPYDIATKSEIKSLIKNLNQNQQQ